MPPPSSHPAPGTTAALRQANVQRVVEALRSSAPGPSPSQADLARLSNLAPATVSALVRDLAQSGVLRLEPGRGRRGSSIQFAPDAGYVVGVDFGHSHLAVAVADLGGRILAETRRRIAPDHAAADGLALAHELVLEQLGALGASLADVHSLGLGLPAPVSSDVVQSSGILPGWVGVRPRHEAQKVFGVPVTIDNDANLGALAEQRQGAGRGCGSLFFVKISSGVGAGIVLDGHLVRGSAGMAGEIGHFTLDDQGPFCRCGNRGCLEAYVSVPHALDALASTLPDLTFDGIVAEARAGHSGAIRIFEDIGLRLGQALALVTNLLNPDVLVIGGELARADELLLTPVRTAMRRHALSTVSASLQITTASLKDRASLVGSVILALEHADLTAVLSGSPVRQPTGD